MLKRSTELHDYGYNIYRGEITQLRSSHPRSFRHGNELRGRDEGCVGTADEHVHEEQHEIPVIQVAHAVVHPRAVVVHLHGKARRHQHQHHHIQSVRSVKQQYPRRTVRNTNNTPYTRMYRLASNIRRCSTFRASPAICRNRLVNAEQTMAICDTLFATTDAKLTLPFNPLSYHQPI